MFLVQVYSQVYGFNIKYNVYLRLHIFNCYKMFQCLIDEIQPNILLNFKSIFTIFKALIDLSLHKNNDFQVFFIYFF